MSANPSTSTVGSVALTKFRVPRMRSDTVVRTALLHRLAGAVETTPLTLVCAPAGSGKTTLLTHLATTLRDQAGCTVLWIAIDTDDNDANRLFAALVQAVAPLGLTWESDPRALAAGVSGAGHQSRVALAALVNALCTSPARRIVIVLDDLHRVDRDEAFLLLESLIERLPDHVALVLGSRVEPPLPLARWRAHGELAEFSPAELRFTEAEALELAEQRQRITGDTALAQRAHDAFVRSQGWAVGLSMLLQSRPGSDVLPVTSATATASNGSDVAQRRLFEYLAEEILASLPAELQAFVLRVSILVELNPSLCNALTGRSDARPTLEALYRRNLFLTSIDETVPVLRFHDLFRDFLQAELIQRHGTEVRDLHERAARAETVPSRAIQHFLKAECWDDAVALIVRVGEALLAQGGIATIERWLAQIPESAHQRNPRVAYLRGACAWLRWDWNLARRELVPAFAGMTDPADAPQRIRAGFQLVDALNSSGEVDAAWRQLEELATLPLDELGQAELAVQRAWCLAPSGRLDEIEHHMLAFIRHTEHHPAAICPVVSGRIHCMLIGLPGVASTFERFAQLADSVRTPVAAPWHLAAYAVSGWASLWRGDRTQALAALTRAQASFHQFGSIRLLGERIGQLKAVLSAVTGDFATAFRIGDEHIRGLQAPEVARHSAVWLRSYRHGVARMYWMAGHAEGHRALLPHLVAPRGAHEWPFTDTAADVARGQSLIL
jgi:LuxR family transcriptional regulator, maltose regulon positive regulatory protein